MYQVIDYNYYTAAVDADFARIDLGQTPENGRRERGVGDGMIHPLIFDRGGGIAEDAGALGASLGQLGPLVVMPLERHADRRVALLVPAFDPSLRGRPSAAMNQNHARDLASYVFRNAEPGKNLRRFSLVIQAGV